MSTNLSDSIVESPPHRNGDSHDASQPIRHARRRSRQRYYVSVPPEGGAGSPLLVVVHGLARDAQQYARSFGTLCEARGVVLVVPVFGDDSNDYQRLGRTGRGPRSDVALEGILEEVVHETGAAAHPIYMFGHGAGAQFAHRFAMAYPHRVAAAAVAGAGWYTFPNRRRRFPYGIRKSQDLPDVRFDAEEFLRVPMYVLVGEQDTSTRKLRRGKRADRQGKTRIERAMNWVEAMRRAAEKRGMTPLVNLSTIAESDNSFESLVNEGRLPERVFEALFGIAPKPKESLNA